MSAHPVERVLIVAGACFFLVGVALPVIGSTIGLPGGVASVFYPFVAFGVAGALLIPVIVMRSRRGS